MHERPCFSQHLQTSKYHPHVKFCSDRGSHLLPHVSLLVLSSRARIHGYGSMDTLLFPQPSDIASELSLNELTPVTSSEGDYAQVPFSPTDLQAQSFPYDTKIAHNLYQQQQFNNLDYPSTHSLFLIDTTQPWTLSTQQQSYTATTSSSLPEQPVNAPLAATSTPSSSFIHGYVPVAKRPSIASSIHSTLSDGEEQPTPDSTSERRRQRRRAQNRVAQRAFRARKEVPLTFPFPLSPLHIVSNFQSTDPHRKQSKNPPPASPPSNPSSRTSKQTTPPSPPQSTRYAPESPSCNARTRSSNATAWGTSTSTGPTSTRAP
jgi:hypothetical protein